MAIARYPEPEEIDCLLRNAELRDEIEPYLDESIFEIDFRTLPTEAENRFLESMIAWEKAALEPIARWFDPPLAPPTRLHARRGSTPRETLGDDRPVVREADRPRPHRSSLGS